jgi:hypothetical protein
MKTHAHSLDANATGRSGSFTQRAVQIMDVLRRTRRPMTDREVMHALGYCDMNAVRPRITELIQAGALHEAGERTDPATGKTVRTVSVDMPASGIFEAGTLEQAEQVVMYFTQQGAA